MMYWRLGVKTFDIEIKSEAQVRKEFISAFKAAQEKRPFKPIIGVSFVSLEAVRNLLTEKRMEILHVIREKRPKSIYALAKLTGRNFKNVYDDVQTLKYYGLLQIRKSSGKSRKSKKSKRSGQSFSVPYQAINIHAGI